MCWRALVSTQTEEDLLRKVTIFSSDLFERLARRTKNAVGRLTKRAVVSEVVTIVLQVRACTWRCSPPEKASGGTESVEEVGTRPSCTPEPLHRFFFCYMHHDNGGSLHRGKLR